MENKEVPGKLHVSRFAGIPPVHKIQSVIICRYKIKHKNAVFTIGKGSGIVDSTSSTSTCVEIIIALMSNGKEVMMPHKLMC